MINIEEFTNTAADFKVSTEKAYRQGIIGTNDRGFQITKETFQDILGDREYEITKRNDEERPWRYSTKIVGLTFYCITPFLLFADDKDKIEGDKQ